MCKSGQVRVRAKQRGSNKWAQTLHVEVFDIPNLVVCKACGIVLLMAVPQAVTAEKGFPAPTKGGK